MDERIRELLKQAEERYPRHLAVAVPEVVLRQDALEKFDELIVRECMDIAKRTGDNFGSWNPDVVVGGRGGTFCVYHNIKNWFGVEE